MILSGVLVGYDWRFRCRRGHPRILEHLHLYLAGLNALLKVEAAFRQRVGKRRKAVLDFEHGRLRRLQRIRVDATGAEPLAVAVGIARHVERKGVFRPFYPPRFKSL